MYIEHDYHYINANENLLIEKGYGKISIHSIHFDRHYSEEQKEKNRQIAEKMTKEEWSIHCEKVAKSFAKPLNDILKQFIDRYDIHQISEETDTMEHYKSDWDLYFWSNKGWNGKDYMDCFKLDFNTNRSVEKNMALLNEIIPLVESMEYENIGCRIQYNVVLDKEKIEREAKEICKKLTGKFITYCGIEGKIKVVDEVNNYKTYGFFRKGARSKYYKVSNTEILAMKLQEAI